MRLLRTACGLLLPILVGCGTIVRPSDLRPPLHPLLESPARPAGLDSLGTLDAVDEGAVGGDADPDLADGRRALVLRALGRLDGADLDDLALVRAAFADARLDGAPEGMSLAALRERSRPRQGAPRPADLVFFDGAGFGPRVGVVTQVLRGGVVEAAFVTRGAVRRIRLDPRRPDVRRTDGRIVNTFVRPKRRDDPPGTAYLAGQLVESVRTLLD
jgi:hypothetical protein